MINSAIIEDLRDHYTRYLYISFYTNREAHYSWETRLVYNPSKLELPKRSDTYVTFFELLQHYTNTRRLIGIFTDHHFTDEIPLTDYPELFI